MKRQDAPGETRKNVRHALRSLSRICRRRGGSGRAVVRPWNEQPMCGGADRQSVPASSERSAWTCWPSPVDTVSGVPLPEVRGTSDFSTAVGVVIPTPMAEMAWPSAAGSGSTDPAPVSRARARRDMYAIDPGKVVAAEEAARLPSLFASLWWECTGNGSYRREPDVLLSLQQPTTRRARHGQRAPAKCVCNGCTPPAHAPTATHIRHARVRGHRYRMRMSMLT